MRSNWKKRWVSRDDVISSMRGDTARRAAANGHCFSTDAGFCHFRQIALSYLAAPRVPVLGFYRRPKYPFRNSKAQLFQSLAHRLAFRMAFNIGIELRRQKAIGLIVSSLVILTLLVAKLPSAL